MDTWRKSFLEKLSKAQAQWTARFENTLETYFVPVLDEYQEFLGDNGFRVSTPLCEPGRRSIKFELAENAYLLLILRSTGVGEFELRCESFVPGNEPVLTRLAARIVDLDETWVTERLQTALDAFVSLLAKESAEPVEELVGV